MNIGVKNSTGKSCLFCSSTDHALINCSSFAELSSFDQTKKLKEERLCFGCLGTGHMKRFCRSPARCGKCGRKLPTILHFDKAPPPMNSERSPSENSVSRPLVGSSTGAGDNCTLAIIPVKVGLKNSTKTAETYCFLDPGSTLTLCSESLLRKLGCQGQQKLITLQTVEAYHQVPTCAIRNLQVRNFHSDEPVDLPTVYSKQELNVSKQYIPAQTDISCWHHLADVDLSPPRDFEIGLIIGNNAADAFTPLEIRTGPPGSPHATRTRLGWVVWNVKRLAPGRNDTFTSNHIAAIEDLESLVRSSIQLDFPEHHPDVASEMSVEDKRFLDIVERSVKANKSGRYEIDLPFKSLNVLLPDNISQARNRLIGLKRRFERDDAFRRDYNKFMNAMIDAGHAELVPEGSLPSPPEGRVWYLPHHGVYHKTKPGKIRVVFDGSATYCGVSLNSVLLQGPYLTSSLIGVLERFRENKIAVMADVEKMFLQVEVPAKDRDCLRFLWWLDSDYDREPVTYRMTRHLFGAISSPSCANSALNQTASDNAVDFDPDIVDSVYRNFYMDDFLKSVDLVADANSVASSMISLCDRGGFKLRGWCCNKPEGLASIPSELRAGAVKELELHPGDACEQALGMSWLLESDSFVFTREIPQRPATRRGVLSVVSSIYDPLGLLAPFVLPAKLLLQQLCLRKAGWDDDLFPDELQRWRSWLSDMASLHKVKIPRCYKPDGFNNSIASCELHTFADACEGGYGTATYVRLVDTAGMISCSLMMGKARVSPLKSVSIPRLELTAGAMAVRLTNMLMKEIDFPVDDVRYWTDTTIVLCYIRNESSRYKTFVANRVSAIHSGSTVESWKHVEGKENPADYASRGLTVRVDEKLDRWLYGPPFLSQPVDQWPEECQTIEIKSDELELKKMRLATLLLVQISCLQLNTL